MGLCLYITCDRGMLGVDLAVYTTLHLVYILNTFCKAQPLKLHTHMLCTAVQVCIRVTIIKAFVSVAVIPLRLSCANN